MQDNEINFCNTLENGNEKWRNFPIRNASRQVTSIHRWKLVKYDMLVQNGLFHKGNSNFT